ncbi:MAG: DUF2828 family protein [Treponema sp.]|nr:DUF2828 family protein [Treponema sp.]
MCLDFFSLCGGMRKNPGDAEKLFVRAYGENPSLAVKILFYMRDIRGGLGERDLFRHLLCHLAEFYPETVRKILYAVPKYGRWDDLLCLLATRAKDDAVSVIKAQLEKDRVLLNAANADKAGECAQEAGTAGGVSLLGKWLPSINASSKETVRAAKTLMAALGMNAAGYRKLCSALRKRIQIIEDYLRRSDYSFDYSRQPSQAMFRYKKAFIRNDKERYSGFLKKVIEQVSLAADGAAHPDEEQVKLNVKTLYPYQIVNPYLTSYHQIKELSEEEELALEASWKSLRRDTVKGRTIVVRDGSGSMYWNGEVPPISVATSLALFFSEQLAGAYRNSFITFSKHPELIQIPDTADTLKKKLDFITHYDDIANTDIGKVYQLILDVAKSGNVPKEEMIERVLIISDMEFDRCDDGCSSFESYRRKFAKAGYDLPEIVFWNVAARDVHLPVTMNEKGVKLVSGASANIFSDVVSGDLKVVTPYEFMLKILAPYAEFDKVA